MADQFSPPSSRIAGIVIVGSIGSLLAAALLAYFAFAASVVDVPDFGGTYIEGTLGPPPTLVSILANDDTARTISGLIFNGLTRYATDGTVVPDLATGWEIDSQSRSFVFHLRDDVRWQDGMPLTVDDVLFTYGLLASPQRRDPVWSNVESRARGRAERADCSLERRVPGRSSNMRRSVSCRGISWMELVRIKYCLLPSTWSRWAQAHIASLNSLRNLRCSGQTKITLAGVRISAI